MNEEEIVVVVFGQVTLELLANGLRAFDLRHAHQLGKPFIHRINGQRRGLQLVAIFEQRDVRLMRNAAHEKAVRRILLREE